MNKIFAKITNLSCLSFMVLSFIINFTTWIFSENNSSRMLKIRANLLIFLVCFIVWTILIYKKRKKENFINVKIPLLFTCGIVYTLSFFLLNTTQYIIEIANFWDGYSLLLLLLFGFVSSLLIEKIKIKNYLLSSILNYIVVGIFYYIFYVVKANFKSGTSLLISIGIYTIIFTISAIVYYLVVAKKQTKENTEKEYKNLFT